MRVLRLLALIPVLLACGLLAVALGVALMAVGFMAATGGEMLKRDWA